MSNALSTWSGALAVAVVLVLGLHHFGYDVSAHLGAMLRGIGHALAQPL